MTFHPDTPCPFCGLGCGDIGIDQDDSGIAPRPSGCPQADRLFRRSAAVPTDARIAGTAVSMDDAVAEVARLLGASHAPLIAGLATDVDGALSTLTLAERIGATVDHERSDALFRNLAVLRRFGWSTTTLAELRNRCDLVLVVGPDPAAAFPRLWERWVVPEPAFVPDVDPANGRHGEVVDLWLRDDRIAADPGPGATPDAVYDVTGKVVMAGAIDIHSHIAGARYIEMGFTAAFEPAMLGSNARHAHLEMSDIPYIDTGGYLVLGNDDFLLDLIATNAGQAAVNDYIAWMLTATQSLAVKVVNPGGINAFKFNARKLDLDEAGPHYDITPRTVLTVLARAVYELGLPHPLHVHGCNLGIPGNVATTLDTIQAASGLPMHMTHIQFHSYDTAGDRKFSSGAAVLAEAVNRTPTLSLGIECEAGCGVVPFRYRDKSYVNALGGALPGLPLGMRGGLISVGGSAGDRAAERMRRGIVVVVGTVGAYAAGFMVAGTLAAGGGCGPHPGFGMRRGLEGTGSWFERAATTRAHRFIGDLAEGGHGEILAMV